MSLSNHTPGPWSAFQRPAEVGTNYFRILLHGFPDEQPKYGQDSLAGYCGEANANLIAAAPELLDALEMVRDADNDCEKDGMQRIPDPARLKIDKAIAKAKGETP